MAQGLKRKRTTDDSRRPAFTDRKRKTHGFNTEIAPGTGDKCAERMGRTRLSLKQCKVCEQMRGV